MASGAKLLEKMRRSPHGHGQRDFRRLFKHFGFEELKKTKHWAFRHELMDPGDVVLVPRHKDVRAYVARKAVKAIDLVIERQERDR